MNLKKIIISASIALIGFTSCFADPMPNKCPNIEVIKYRGLLLGFKDGCSKTYVAAQYDRYGTSAPWAFEIEVIDAKDAPDALNKASERLTTISGNPEPKPIGEGGGWSCEYKIANDQTVYAYSPDTEGDLSQLSKLKRNHKS